MKSLKSIFYGLAVTTALFFNSSATAGDDRQSATVELKYVGSVNNKPVFQLNLLNNGVDKEFFVNITDDLGNVLYKARFKNNSSKKFMLNTDEINLDDMIRFEVIGKTTNKKFTYEINRSTRTSDETSVVALR
jgi:hypothetical protein